MNFTDKYSNKEEKDKIQISNDAFAIGTVFQEFVDIVTSLIIEQRRKQ